MRASLGTGLYPSTAFPQKSLASSQRSESLKETSCAQLRSAVTGAGRLYTLPVSGLISSATNGKKTLTPEIQAYLERSGSVPIDVQIGAYASRLLASHTGRISSLRVFLDHPSDLEEIAKHLSKPAPILKAISLRVSGWNKPTLALPPTLFEALLSSVRTLTLHGTILSPSPRPRKFSQVTKFIFTTNSSANFPFTVLLDNLERMPLLQLFEATFASRPDVIPRNRVVTLPHLEQITLTELDDHAPPEIPILPALYLPRVRKVSVRSARAASISAPPILPLSFEEQLPKLSTVREASITLSNEFKLDFFGRDQSVLTLSIGE